MYEELAAVFLMTLRVCRFFVFDIFESADSFFVVEESKVAHRTIIYIRTPSETQGEKSSPVEQEAGCRSLAEEKGFDLVRVYRDVEKYRVGNRLVEPSGSRSDRRGFVAMLKSASSFIHQFPHEPRHVAAGNNDDTKFFINTCVS